MELSEIWIGIIIPLVIGPVFIYLKTLRDEISERNYAKNREKYRCDLETVYNLLNDFYWPLYISLLSIQQYNYQIPLKNRYRYDSDNSNETTNSDENNINFVSKNNVYNETDCDKIYYREQYRQNDNTNRSPIDMVSDSSNDNFEIAINITPMERTIVPRQNSNKSFSRKKTSNKRNIILDKNTLFLLKQNLEKQYVLAEQLIEENITKSCIHLDLNLEMIKFIKYTKIRKIIKEGSPDQEYNINYFGINNNLEALLVTTQTCLENNNELYKNLINNPVLNYLGHSQSVFIINDF